MTTAGWVFMVTSVLFVYGLAAWCYRKMLRGGEDDEGRGGEPSEGGSPGAGMGASLRLDHTQ